MVYKFTGGIIVLFLLVGSFLVFGQERRDTGKMSSLRTVTDGAGRRVSVPEHPQRVVALNASNIDLYVGVGGELVGRATTEALSPAVRDAVQRVPTVGLPPNPNLEQLVALKPDLVLAVNIPFHHVLVPVLEKAGIPILLQTLESYQQVLDTLQFYGELAGQPDKAAAEIARIENQYNAAVASAKGKPAPKVLILWGTTESFNMVGSASFAGDLLQRLGGVNVADQAQNTGPVGGYVPLSLEFVAKANPEVILFITHSADAKVEAKFRSELASQPAWQGIQAVQQNRVYKLPYHLFAVNPGTQVGEAIEVLAGLLYPN
jgi:iron complex transport system substrate-binding protein